MANFYIQQSISINLIKIGGISNSSVLQIGSAGIIKPASFLYNTGGFTGPAPSPDTPFTAVGEDLIFEPDLEDDTGTYLEAPSVPLAAPTRGMNKEK
ncbi:spore germination protein GerPB [Bacillus sp. 31A1R]|uniref:Spore germination protein GerPB n=1 Tax=Robertmurraya mangrovi TaxID=3098077 RepID=A0ABU5IT01_9BACI|nr:spore germination protein GerPB [Bacillus sp. 31A1R]MDZ5470274.1 spore germination protein GerPB [Bacillus sp. 31A1R]